MSSTNFNVGISADTKISSRVLKPPGGGHTNIFAPPEEVVRQQRPKNNQQNSAMMGEIMGKKTGEVAEVKINSEVKEAPVSNGPTPAESAPPKMAAQPEGRARVPPGGFSSGLW